MTDISATQESKGLESFKEPRETLSPQEERLERWRNTIGLFHGPAVALMVYLLPMPSLSREAHILAAIISWVCVWWITEPIPIPMSALVGAVLCVLFGLADAKKVFAPLILPRPIWSCQ